VIHDLDEIELFFWLPESERATCKRNSQALNKTLRPTSGA
jgi:hypothetical protein